MSDRGSAIVGAGAGASAGSGGSGGGSDAPLRSVEQRLARIETELRHVATKAWVLGGIIGGMALSAVVTAIVVKFLGP